VGRREFEEKEEKVEVERVSDEEGMLDEDEACEEEEEESKNETRDLVVVRLTSWQLSKEIDTQDEDDVRKDEGEANEIGRRGVKEVRDRVREPEEIRKMEKEREVPEDRERAEEVKESEETEKKREAME
jgi:hypothetical protein